MVSRAFPALQEAGVGWPSRKPPQVLEGAAWVTALLPPKAPVREKQCNAWALGHMAPGTATFRLLAGVRDKKAFPFAR
jgi:hypothetical protein